MRIALISDIHVDINKAWRVLDVVSEMVNEAKADALIIAGDVSDMIATTFEALDELEKLCDCPLYYVAGNHDMWNRDCPERKTDEIYKAYLKDQRCLSAGPVVLKKDNVELAVVGDVGWYDYTMASSEYSREELDVMTIGKRTFFDKLYNSWTNDNPAQMQVMLKRLEEQLKTCQNFPILAVTHMLPVKDFCVPPDSEMWRYMNAFMGSTALHELYRRYSVRYGVCGHVHYRARAEKDGISYICPCLSYDSEWHLFGLKDNDVYTHVKDALVFLDIEA